MPTIFFGGNSGKTFAKKRKRMPGTNKNFKPEMKSYDGFNASSAVDTYSERFFMNLVNSTTTVPGSTSKSWYPYGLPHPVVGSASNQRTGKNYLLRFLKFKGMIITYHNCTQPINWRLCLCRLDKSGLGLPGQSGYLEYFKNTVSNNIQNVADAEAYCTHNYYYKMKFPEISHDFKRKVIASGTIPKNFDSFKGQMPGGTGGTLTSFNYQTWPRNEKIAGYQPFDVSVTLNDNIDPDTMKYFVVLETDIGYGVMDYAQGGADMRNLEYDYRQFELQIFCKAYFEDY